MQTCICSSCKNLKSVIDENDEENGIVETCEFDFPSEDCSECELDGCALTCEHYSSDQADESFILVKCRNCDTELKVSTRNDENAEVYCVSCYLSKK